MERIDVALLVIRIAFGASMAYHGYNKLASGIKGTSGWFSSIGMRWPVLQAWTAALTEVIGGVFFAIGFLTGISAMSMVALMIVAIITVHWKVGYFIFLPHGGWEYCAAIAAVSIGIGIAGPGEISIDHVLGLSSSYGAILAPLGILLALCHLAISYRPPAAQQTS